MAGTRVGKYKFGPGPLNTNSGPGPVHTNSGPGPVTTTMAPGLVNTNSGPGLGAKQRAGGRKIQTPVL